MPISDLAHDGEATSPGCFNSLENDHFWHTPDYLGNAGSSQLLKAKQTSFGKTETGRS